MRRQWIIGAGVTLAIVLFVSWIARNTYWDEITIPTFLRGEAASNPFYAAQRLTEELGATAEWRRALGELPSTDSIMMLTHWNWDLIQARRAELERWVESGGRLLLDGTMAGGADAFADWSGLRAEFPNAAQIEEEESLDDEEVDPEDYEPRSPCRDLDLAQGESQTLAARTGYTLCGLSVRGWLTGPDRITWGLEDDQGLQAARVTIGRGSVTLINGEPFGTRELLNVDNAVLFIDATRLHRDDHVVFVSEEEHASILELIWIYGAPAVVLGIMLIAIALWRNAVRFGPFEAAPDGSRRSLAEQIRGTGRFALRVGGGRALHAAMVRALHEAAQSRIQGYAAMQHADRIAAIARLAEVDPENLAETINFAGRRSAHHFSQAIGVIDAARTRLIERSSRRSSNATSEPHSGTHINS